MYSSYHFRRSTAGREGSVGFEVSEKLFEKVKFFTSTIIRTQTPEINGNFVKVVM